MFLPNIEKCFFSLLRSDTDLTSRIKREDSDSNISMKHIDQLLNNISSSPVTSKLRISTSKESQSTSTQRISSSSSFSSSDVLDPPSLESQSYSLHLNESSLLSFLNVHQSNRDRYNVVSSKTKKDVSTSPPVLIENGNIIILFL